MGAGDSRVVVAGVGVGARAAVGDRGGTDGRLFIVSILELSLALLICDVRDLACSARESGLGRCDVDGVVPGHPRLWTLSISIESLLARFPMSATFEKRSPICTVACDWSEESLRW